MQPNPADPDAAQLPGQPAPPDPAVPPPVYPPPAYPTSVAPAAIYSPPPEYALPDSTFSGYVFTPPTAPRARPVWPVAVGAFLLGGLVFSVLTCAAALLFLPASRSVATPQVGVAPTPVVNSRPTALPAPAARATATALAQVGTRVYGPLDGELQLKADNRVAYHSTVVDVQDFVVEATFRNPYQPDTYGWDYGFFFRDTGVNQAYRLYVTSDREWALKFTDPSAGDPPGHAFAAPPVAPTATLLPSSVFTTVAGGTVPDLDTAVDGTNRLRLAVRGGLGLFFINDTYIATLDVSRKIEQGTISVGSAFRVENNNPDHTVVYTDFSVWSLDR